MHTHTTSSISGLGTFITNTNNQLEHLNSFLDGVPTAANYTGIGLTTRIVSDIASDTLVGSEINAHTFLSAYSITGDTKLIVVNWSNLVTTVSKIISTLNNDTTIGTATRSLYLKIIDDSSFYTYHGNVHISQRYASSSSGTSYFVHHNLHYFYVCHKGNCVVKIDFSFRNNQYLYIEISFKAISGSCDNTISTITNYINNPGTYYSSNIGFVSGRFG